ncbi:hypothetical protein [Acidisoma sp. 7E03]
MSYTSVEPAVAATLRPGLSWSAVFGGAAVATAVTVMLTALGSGIGLASVSPMAHDNPSAVTFTVGAAIWLIIVQWIASFFGGYLAGRLRPSLGGVHRDEVTFRDTASGFVAWAVAALFALGLLVSGAGSVIGSVGQAVTAAAGGAQTTGSTAAPFAPSGYVLDTLFRPSRDLGQTSNPEAKAEAGRILATEAVAPISTADHDFLVQLVEANTGLSPADATTRVDQTIAAERQTIAEAKKAANAARKAAAALAAYTFFSMLVGAFIACVAGAIGGRQRDAY